ncbi:MAG: flavin reductase family protein [Trueperaceae bacterium]|nr:flavin reductase family protein [Trueperaceae bacterium]
MIDANTFRDALGRFASGVTVVSMDTDGGPRGITVNAFSSLSLDPPLVGVAIDHRAGAHGSLAQAARYGVSVLARSQQILSDRFAGRDVEVEVGWERLAEAPVVRGALVQLSCEIVQRVVVGDHTLFVGQVESALTRDGVPLLYHRGGYEVDGWR